MKNEARGERSHHAEERFPDSFHGINASISIENCRHCFLAVSVDKSLNCHQSTSRHNQNVVVSNIYLSVPQFLVNFMGCSLEPDLGNGRDNREETFEKGTKDGCGTESKAGMKKGQGRL